MSNWGQRTVSVVDLGSRSPSGSIQVGTQPSAMVLSPDGHWLYVANTDSDSISVIDTTTNTVDRTFSVSPYPKAPVGSNPNALAISADGGTLYVANAGNNDLDVVALAVHGGSDMVTGMIPTAWYPTGVALVPSGHTIYAVSAKGNGAGPNPEGPDPRKSPESAADQYIGSMILGTLSAIAVPGPEQLAADTLQVRQNNGWDQVARLPLFDKIKHVIYVVNENRTYDQVLGDLGKGNGDPSLTLFGTSVAPNHHSLADRFTTLDNLFAAGEVSNDGWEWSTAATASTLDQKTWPTLYGGRGYFYSGEGGTLGAAPGRNPSKSYIWDELTARGLSFRNYGFWATGDVPSSVYNEPNLDANTDHQYPGFNMAISDQVRVGEWLREFEQYQQSGDLPAVEFVKFPRDHTCGTDPSCPTPASMVADSDYALGQLVDAVSHSEFWTSTAIFVIEDDAQDGPDHVDAHRTIGHVISPYTQTGAVDSTYYSTVSMLRTMELILGLRPMTQFDASATPMLASFTNHPNFGAYDAIQPAQARDQMNSPSAPLAGASSRMDFSREDLAPSQLLNEAIWKSVRGAHSQMPAPVHRLPDDKS